MRITCKSHIATHVYLVNDMCHTYHYAHLANPTYMTVYLVAQRHTPCQSCTAACITTYNFSITLIPCQPHILSITQQHIPLHIPCQSHTPTHVTIHTLSITHINTYHYTYLVNHTYHYAYLVNHTHQCMSLCIHCQSHTLSIIHSNMYHCISCQSHTLLITHNTYHYAYFISHCIQSISSQ